MIIMMPVSLGHYDNAFQVWGFVFEVPWAKMIGSLLRGKLGMALDSIPSC